MRLLMWFASRPIPLIGYGLAVTAFVLALLTRLSLQGTLPPGFPYLTFFPAVILTAFVAGTGPGILCALLSGIGAWVWFISPDEVLSTRPDKVLAIGFYVFIVGIDIAIIHAMRRALQRLRAEMEVSARLADRQGTLFSELQHRVANNLTFVISLLTLQKNRIATEPEAAVSIFDSAVHRLGVMGRMHRRLHSAEALDQPIGTYIRALCDDLIEATGATNVICDVAADPVRLDLSQLTTLSLLLAELVTNSLKHAFPKDVRGTIYIELKRLDSKNVLLAVSDDGPGMPEGRPTGASLGTGIVRGLANQLDADLILPRTGESMTRLVFVA